METAPSIWAELKTVYTDIDRNEFKGTANGRIEIEVHPCSCKYEPDVDEPGTACGDDSDCINRALFFECSLRDCPCGKYCLNRRFANREYAQIEVFHTDKKGYGLRTKKSLIQNQFVIEYVGEVVTRPMFLNRVIDAGRRGNIARFMNHSCNPNCEVQKWVVGSELRMGIFTLRDIKENEELTFDYKFERYGAEPQPCYCREACCKGVIGGEKQSDLRGYDDEDFETTEFIDSSRNVKAVKRKSTDSDDEDYRDISPLKEERGLENEDAVRKLVKSMVYSTSKGSRVAKLLRRLQLTTLPQMQRKFLQYHGLAVLKSYLMHFAKTDSNICHETLRILQALPISSRNTIIDNQLEEAVTKLTQHPQYYVVNSAKELLDVWAELPVVYRIPKRINSNGINDAGERKRSIDEGATNDRKRSKSEVSDEGTNGTPTPAIKNEAFLAALDASGRSNESAVFLPRAQPKRNEDLSKQWGGASRSPSANSMMSNTLLSPRIDGLAELPLPKSWKTAMSEGKVYYYNVVTRKTQWEFPVERPVPEDIKSLSSIVEGVSEAELEAIMKQAEDSATASNNSLASKSGNSTSSDAIKALRPGVSEIVIKTLSKCKGEIDGDRFKKLARKITHQILEKEAKRPPPIPAEVSDEMKAKIKKFTRTAMEKAGIKIAEKKDKKSHHSKKKRK
ncbi:histone methyltransferase set2 [Dinochytrium kinnereticum]|nr:histone methyltransferase set2 [Dinochytrium kinnereticum]